jgi:hypothetical protein
MGEERIWQKINEMNDDMTEMKSDMSQMRGSLNRIETALLGDDFGNEGYGERIEKLEHTCDEVDDEIKTSKIYRRIFTWAFATLIGSGGVWSIVKFLIPLFKQ